MRPTGENPLVKSDLKNLIISLIRLLILCEDQIVMNGDKAQDFIPGIDYIWLYTSLLPEAQKVKISHLFFFISFH